MAMAQPDQLNFSIVPSGSETPAPMPGVQTQEPQPVPDGRSPNGKRPRSDTVLTGKAPQSPDETGSGVLEMQPLLRSTAEAVQWNCELLNAVI